MRHTKEQQRTIDAPANRQDENSDAARQNRCESPRHPAKRLSFLWKSENGSFLSQEKGKNWFQSAPCGAREDELQPHFFFPLAERRNGVARQRRKTLLASFLLVQTDSALWKRCFRDFIDFAAIAASGGATVLRDRLPASLRSENAARWFCLQVVSVQRSRLA